MSSNFSVFFIIVSIYFSQDKIRHIISLADEKWSIDVWKWFSFSFFFAIKKKRKQRVRGGFTTYTLYIHGLNEDKDNTCFHNTKFLKTFVFCLRMSTIKSQLAQHCIGTARQVHTCNNLRDNSKWCLKQYCNINIHT